MKYLLLFFLITDCLLPITSNAQSHKQKLIDSLQAILQTSSPDTLHVSVLNELAWIYRNNDYDKSYNYGMKAKELAIKINDDNGLATAYNRIGLILKNRGKYTEALASYNKALAIEKKQGYRYGISRAKNQIGGIYILTKRYELAIPFFKESIRILNAIGQEPKTAIKKFNLAICYNNIGDLKKANQYYLEALRVYEKAKRKNKMAKCYLGLGSLHQRANNFNKAHEYLLKAKTIFESNGNKKSLIKVYSDLGLLYFKIKEYKTSIHFYKKSLHLKKTLGTTKDIQATYNNLGLVMLSNFQEDSAKVYFDYSLQISEKVQDVNTQSLVYNNLGLLHYKAKDYRKALEFFQKSLSFPEHLIGKYNQRNALENISFAYAKLGNYEKAFQHYQQYNKAKDALESSFREAMEIKDKYEAEKKKRALAEKDTEIQKGKVVRQKLFNYILGVGLLLSLMVVFAVVRTYQDRRKVQKKQQKIDDLLREQEFLALSKMLEGQEQERNRIAQDLHDRLGGKLSLIKIKFEALNQSEILPKMEEITQYQDAMKLLDETVDNVREISHNISSRSLEKFGLIAALEDLQSQIQDIGIIQLTLNVHGFDGQRLPVTQEVQVYQVLQELINNTLKHAEASELTIQLYWRDDHIHLNVEDNGNGFDLDDATKKGGIGLRGVKFRIINNLSGKIEIDAAEGQGTSVMIDIPLINRRLKGESQ